MKNQMDISPTPEFMEAIGRAYDKYGPEVEGYPTYEHIHEQLALMLRNNDSTLRDIADKDERHRAVAAQWPHLYTKKGSPNENTQ